MAVYLLDSVKVATQTTGTGSVTVGAAEPGYLTPVEAGAVNGRVYTWRLDDGDDFEIFIGTYSSAGPTVSRDTVLVSKISGTAGTSKINLSGKAKLSAVPVADYVVTPRQIREKLTANRTYYVRTDGSDSNDGLTDSPGGAFRTIAKAIEVVAALDISIYDVTIQVQDGTWTEPVVVNAPWIGAGTVTLQGNTSTPANCVLNVSGTCVTVNGMGSKLTVTGFTITSTIIGLLAQNGGAISLGGGIVFGTCGSAHMRANGQNALVYAQSASYTISGGSQHHLMASPRGEINIFGATVTLSGTPNFSVSFAFADRLSFINAGSATFIGSATGTRYQVASNSVINTAGGGANFFPGNAAGSTATGGQYI